MGMDIKTYFYIQAALYTNVGDSLKKQHSGIFRELLRFYESKGITNFYLTIPLLQEFLEHQLTRAKEQQLQGALQLINNTITSCSVLNCIQSVSAANQTPKGWLRDDVSFADVIRQASNHNKEFMASIQSGSRLHQNMFLPPEYEAYINTCALYGSGGKEARLGAQMAAEFSTDLAGLARSQDSRMFKVSGLGVDSLDSNQVKPYPLKVLILTRLGQAKSGEGYPHSFPIVPHKNPLLDAVGLLCGHFLITLATLAESGHKNVFELMLDTQNPDAWFAVPLFPDDVFSNSQATYTSQLRNHENIISQVLVSEDDSAFEKDAKLHLAKNTGNSILLRGGVPEIDRKAMGWNESSVQKRSYDSKDAMATVSCAAVLGGHGSFGKFREAHYDGRGQVVFPVGFWDTWLPKFLPGLLDAEVHIRDNLAGYRGKKLTKADRRAMAGPRDASNTLKAARFLLDRFLRNLPFAMDAYGSDWVVLRRVPAVRELLVSPKWLALAADLRAAHQKSKEDQDYNEMSPRERDALLLEKQRVLIAESVQQTVLAMQQAAVTAPTVSVPSVSVGIVPVFEKRAAVCPPADIPASKRQRPQGELNFGNPESVLGIWEVYFAPVDGSKSLKLQFEEARGKVDKGVGGRYCRFKHLPLRVQELVDKYSVSLEAACGVYESVRNELGLTLAYLREAVGLVEPVADVSARGGKKSAAMHLNNLPLVTKEICLECINRHKALLLANKT